MNTKRAHGFALGILFLFWVLPPLQFSLAAEKVSIQAVLSNPDGYDHKEVTIGGKATKVRPRVSRKGNEYTTLTLIDDSKKGMNIFTWGHAKVAEGPKVTITGIYQKVKRVGKNTFYNEVEAKFSNEMNREEKAL
jgi:DNA polymerase III alpha subunit